MNSEFEKWWNKKYERDIFERSDIITAKKAWKAALKWVLNHPNLIDHYQLDYVKEELEKLE